MTGKNPRERVAGDNAPVQVVVARQSRRWGVGACMASENIIRDGTGHGSRSSEMIPLAAVCPLERGALALATIIPIAAVCRRRGRRGRWVCMALYQRGNGVVAGSTTSHRTPTIITRPTGLRGRRNNTMTHEAVVKLFPASCGLGAELAHWLNRALMGVIFDRSWARNLLVCVCEMIFHLRSAKLDLVAPIQRTMVFELGIMLLVNVPFE